MKRTSVDRALKRLHSLQNRLRRKVKETSITVVLLGAGGKGLRQRRKLREELTTAGILALIPEDDFPREIAPSLVEPAVLSHREVDLVFVNVESWGSVTEFAQIHENLRIAPKLRVIVNHSYHPLYGRSTSYLSDYYFTHMAVFGHVYAVDDAQTIPFPSCHEVIMKLAERYRQWRAIRLSVR